MLKPPANNHPQNHTSSVPYVWSLGVIFATLRVLIVILRVFKVILRVFFCPGGSFRTVG
jgi:hypothetical protein